MTDYIPCVVGRPLRRETDSNLSERYRTVPDAGLAGDGCRRWPASGAVVARARVGQGQQQQALVARRGRVRPHPVHDRDAHRDHRSARPAARACPPGMCRPVASARVRPPRSPGVRYWERDGSGDCRSGAPRRWHVRCHSGADLRPRARPAGLNPREPGCGPSAHEIESLFTGYHLPAHGRRARVQVRALVSNVVSFTPVLHRSPAATQNASAQFADGGGSR
jgi:hypothetical protein